MHTKKLLAAGFPIRAVEAFTKMSTANADYVSECQKAQRLLGTGCILGMLGDRGVGKTVMSVALGNTVLDCNPPREVVYTTAHRLFMRYKDSYRRDSVESESQVHAFFRAPSLLVIDEIGRRQESDWENRTLIDLGDARYGDKKDSLFISNQKKDVFDDAIGDSIVSRMNECGGCLIFKWKSFRE